MMPSLLLLLALVAEPAPAVDWPALVQKPHARLPVADQSVGRGPAQIFLRRLGHRPHLQPHVDRLGMGLRHTVLLDQADRVAFRRHAARHGGLLAEGDHRIQVHLDDTEGPTHLDLPPAMGLIRDHAELTVATLSQEHGLIRAESPAAIEGRFKVGEKLEIVPNHSCLTVAHFDYYHVVQDGRVVERWKIERAR